MSNYTDIKVLSLAFRTLFFTVYCIILGKDNSMIDEYLKSKVQEFCLMDDTFFNCFMKDNPEGMEYVLMLAEIYFPDSFYFALSAQNLLIIKFNGTVIIRLIIGAIYSETSKKSTHI